MAISPPTRRWCWRVRSKKTRWRWPSASCRRSPRRELVTGDYRGHGLTVAAARPGFLNIRLAPEVWHAQLRAVLRAGTTFGDSTMGGRRAGQCRIRLGQPDRADACRPRPRRRRRRRARLACSPRPASPCIANTTSTTPARRSTSSRVRSICAIARRWATKSAPSPTASIPATTWSRPATPWPNATGGNGSGGRNANGSCRCATSPSKR